MVDFWPGLVSEVAVGRLQSIKNMVDFLPLFVDIRLLGDLSSGLEILNLIVDMLQYLWTLLLLNGGVFYLDYIGNGLVPLWAWFFEEGPWINSNTFQLVSGIYWSIY